jgi:hypothetical protein
LLVIAAAVLGACGGAARKEIEGNNTGGVIPAELARGANAQSLANAHCARWGASARITFNQIETGSDVVFVCDKAPTPPPPDAKPAPAKKPVSRTS